MLVNVRTVVECSYLHGGCAGTLASRRLGRHSDVIDSVGREIGEQVRVARRRDGHVNVLPEVRVVVVQFVAVDQLVRRQLRRVPRQLDRVRRPRLALEVGRLVRNWFDNSRMHTHTHGRLRQSLVHGV